MAKSAPQARPICRERGSAIDAHFTIAFAAYVGPR
jgi:hypothetical protein